MNYEKDKSGGLYSIGYGNRKIETFVSLLKLYQINLLIDIRSSPFSRFNPSYRKEKLKSILLENKIEYQFLGDTLGGKPSDANMFVNGVLNHELIWNTQTFQSAVETVINLASTEHRVVIMCCELNPDQCHRKTLVGEYVNRIGKNIYHIDKVGLIQNEFHKRIVRNEKNDHIIDSNLDT
jgi:uncharacterized protein (DUF488 family)